jgi:hypothetical protein
MAQLQVMQKSLRQMEMEMNLLIEDGRKPLEADLLLQQMMPALTGHIDQQVGSQWTGLKETIVNELSPLLPAPSAVNYQELAGAIAPLLPEPEPVQTLDYGAIAQQLVPLLKPHMLAVHRILIEEVRAIVPQRVVPASPSETGAGTAIGASNQNQDGQDNQEPEETEAERDTRLEAAYQELRIVLAGKRVSGRALADRARANRAYCNKWLQDWHPENEIGYAKELFTDPQLHAVMNELKSKPLSVPGHGATQNGTGQHHLDTEPVPAYALDLEQELARSN